LDSAPQGRDTWAAINECSGDYVTEVYQGGDQNLPEHMKPYFDTYENCEQGVEVSLLTMLSGDHPAKNPSENGGVNVPEEAWDFLKRFQKPGHKADRMWEGQELSRNQYLLSPKGKHKLIFQNDSNVVLYKDNGQVLWSTGTHHSGADRFVLQTDGNLVLYKPGYWGWNWIFPHYYGPSAVWASNTVGSGLAKLQVNDTGHIAIFHDEVTVWSHH